jgi:hypothetical protein
VGPWISGGVRLANLFNSENVSVGGGSLKGCKTNGKGKFEVPVSSLLECDTVSTGKSLLVGEE